MQRSLKFSSAKNQAFYVGIQQRQSKCRCFLKWRTKYCMES
jgi:hypothetical protein